LWYDFLSLGYRRRERFSIEKTERRPVMRTGTGRRFSLAERARKIHPIRTRYDDLKSNIQVL
jgi:hypothetical protein